MRWREGSLAERQGIKKAQWWMGHPVGVRASENDGGSVWGGVWWGEAEEESEPRDCSE